jgi:hypothetical protein
VFVRIFSPPGNHDMQADFPAPVFAFIAALTLVATSAPVAAKGTVRIQQSDASVQTYVNVGLRLTPNVLRLTSADGVSTLVVARTSCIAEGSLERCSPSSVLLNRDGKQYRIGVASATLYLNLTQSEQPLSFSSTHVSASSMLLAIRTTKGTYLSGSGRLDMADTP